MSIGLGQEKPLEGQVDCPYCKGTGGLPNLAKYLRTIRKNAELTQKEFATIAGYSRTQIQMVEHGKRNPAPGLIESYFSLDTSSTWKVPLIWQHARKGG